MTNVIAVLVMCTPFVALPVIAGWISSRPLTDMDRQLSRVDVELDALKSS